MSSFKFPSPIGGIPFPHDFTPALLFTVLYAISVPFAIYRMVNKRSRTLIILGTVIFTVERVADYAIRAAEAESPNIRTTSFFVGYLQSAYTLGFLSTGQDLNHLARLFVINTTRGPSFTVGFPPKDQFVPGNEEQQPLTALHPRGDAGSSYSKLPLAEQEVYTDEPRLRRFLTRIGHVCLALRLTAIMLAVISGALYFKGVTNDTDAVIICLNARAPALYLCAMICVLMVTPIYRLAAMDNYTTSLTNMGPGSLNGPTAKVLFYALHVAPEWISGTMLLAVNVKDMYGVGVGLKAE
ncbi:hypothetical protein DAEQUDRAFT_769333 [Daedalea quercina L-15889]|uniref:Uncharacterized protein n=1 Tax=Daedalea quercina L-15889 TaxID=1314783 RepID=A0A165LTL7_9APHY|nr:hypothetical protein DAEQUDRAFT_769333 [Daedalea quercina L-15889]